MARSERPPARSNVVSAKPMASSTSKATYRAMDLEGKRAPEFTLSNQDGIPVSLNGLRQHGDVVLYFYPKDMTPGCTTEACAFRDRLELLRTAGAQIVGVSADSPATHRKFIERYGLTFPLLSDPGNEVSKTYGVYQRKSLYGREFMGVERTTFIIGRNGTVRRVFSKVKVNGHADEVLAAVTERA